MNWKKYSIWYTALSSALIFVLCIFLFKECSSAPEVIEIVKNDTVTITKDSIITKIKWKTKFDTIREIKYIDTLSGDTLKIQDTLEIPIDYKVDSFTFNKDSLQVSEKIHYHGYKAEIDTVEFAYQLHYTYEIPKQKPKKFGWCITFGPSISYDITLDTQNKTWSHGPSAGFSIVIGPSYIIK